MSAVEQLLLDGSLAHVAVLAARLRAQRVQLGAQRRIRLRNAALSEAAETRGSSHKRACAGASGAALLRFASRE